MTRYAAAGLALAAVLLASLALGWPVGVARASHAGAVNECAPGPSPTPDGVIDAGEYTESFFDDATKILVYFTCEDSPSRHMHVGLVTPWDGWVAILVQSSDTWDGTLNELRIAYDATEGRLLVMDGYRDEATGLEGRDADLGGTFDVVNASSGAAGAARVYEFAFPLLSDDPFDSQILSAGPVRFSLEYSRSVDLASDPIGRSEYWNVAIEPTAGARTPTRVEMAIGAARALEESTLLVTLRDDRGYPIAFKEVGVYARTVFGFLDLGPVLTNDQGVAQAAYTPRDAGTYVVGAAFRGEVGLLASAGWNELVVGAPASDGGFQIGFADGTTLDLRPVTAVVVTVVMGVWATYAYIFFLVRQALREPPGAGGRRSARPDDRMGGTR